MYVYIKLEYPEDTRYGFEYEVGFYDPWKIFVTESKCKSQEKAANRVSYLNGGLK